MSTKACYGHYMMDECQGHYKCEEYGCFDKTSIDYGACDCKYKGSCHLPRQEWQVKCRNNSDTEYTKVEECSFYKAHVEVEADHLKRGIIGGYIPGNRVCKCHRCGETFNGGDYAVECKPCAIKHNITC